MTRITIADESLRKAANSHETVLVDFWGSYCGPCKRMLPALDELAEEYSGKAHIVKLNVEDHPGAAAELRIMGVPTVVVFRDGVPQDMLVGYQSKDALRSLLNRYA